MAIALLSLATGPEEAGSSSYVRLHVDTGDSVFDSELSPSSGTSALDVLRSERSIETETSTFGEYITCIEDVCQSEGEAWFFYVNDEMAMVGAGAYVVEDGDEIAFLLRNY
jgi:hypothetical protein